MEKMAGCQKVNRECKMEIVSKIMYVGVVGCIALNAY